MNVVMVYPGEEEKPLEKKKKKKGIMHMYM